MENYTYIVRCADGTLYTGWTNDIRKRLEAHNSGKGARYTKPRRPVELVHLEAYETKTEAMRREAAIKRLTREEKLTLIRDGGEAILPAAEKPKERSDRPARAARRRTKGGRSDETFSGGDDAGADVEGTGGGAA